MLDQITGAALIVASIVWLLLALVAFVLCERRARQIQAAKRRHPSARTVDFTSPAAVKYHTDRSAGRD